MDIEIKIPDIGTDVVEVIEIFVKVGEEVKKDDSLITVEGQKVSMEIPSTHSGRVQSIFVEIGQKVQTGSLILVLSSLNENYILCDDSKSTCLNNLTSNDKGHSEVYTNLKNSIDEQEVLVHATPIIRKLARQLNVNLKNIIGSGRKGRITREDVMLHVKYRLKKEKDHVFSKSNFKKIPLELNLTNIQVVSSKHVFKSWSIIPHVTQFDESDITNLEEFRKNYNLKLHSKGTNLKLTILVFVIKIVAKALKIFPKFNSTLCPNTKRKLILSKNINIGIAVDTKDGLLIPVIRNADKKDISELAFELNCFSKKAKSKMLNVSDTTHGNFTISNLGGIGGVGFTPIINYPEVAILGVSKSVIKPSWNEKEFIPRLMLPFSLSYDHRAIDGAEAARFTNCISEMLSDIRLLMC